jgi:N-methylhydantoinase A
MEIYPERALIAISKLGRALNLTPIQAAYGVIDVVNIQMERALRVISVERGHDPRQFNLFSFGGAGGLHAADLARHLGIPRVIISKFASTLSALGMLVSNVIKDYVQTVMVPGTINKHKLDDFFSPMIKQSIRDIKNQGFIKDKIQIQCSLDVRYTGQSYELNIPYSKYFIDAFHEKHSSAYGYSYTEKPIEIVNIRVRSTGIVPPISLPCSNNVTPNPMLPLARYVQVEMREGPEYIPMYTYDQLLPGIRIEGPAMILSTDTTIFTNKHDKTYVDKFLNLLIDINRSD